MASASHLARPGSTMHDTGTPRFDVGRHRPPGPRPPYAIEGGHLEHHPIRWKVSALAAGPLVRCLTCLAKEPPGSLRRTSTCRLPPSWIQPRRRRTSPRVANRGRPPVPRDSTVDLEAQRHRREGLLDAPDLGCTRPGRLALPRATFYLRSVEVDVTVRKQRVPRCIYHLIEAAVDVGRTLPLSDDPPSALRCVEARSRGRRV